jgi:DMSO/TMAO reductase YedYZ molybdopterin-dependent catalytic subunit
MVKRPLTFSMADLKRLPSTSRVAFIECAGNSAGEYHAARGDELHNMHGLVSSSEWTGVALSTVLREVGLEPGAAWILAEGIEDTETWDLLGALKCNVAQGFLMSRPLPSDAVLSWIRTSEWSGYAEKKETAEAVQAVTP